MEAGLEALYPRLWRFCLFLAGARDQAQDLAQATALRAVEKAAQFEPGTHLDRWLFTIARRIWLNEMRAQAVRRGGGLVAIEDTDLSDPSPGVETNIMVAEVFSVMSALPEAQRVTAMLVYVEGFKYAEAAEVLDVPIGTVMSRLASVRKTMNRHFADDAEAIAK